MTDENISYEEWFRLYGAHWKDYSEGFRRGLYDVFISTVAYFRDAKEAYNEKNS